MHKGEEWGNRILMHTGAAGSHSFFLPTSCSLPMILPPVPSTSCAVAPVNCKWPLTPPQCDHLRLQNHCSIIIEPSWDSAVNHIMLRWLSCALDFVLCVTYPTVIYISYIKFRGRHDSQVSGLTAWHQKHSGFRRKASVSKCPYKYLTLSQI